MYTLPTTPPLKKKSVKVGQAYQLHPLVGLVGMLRVPMDGGHWAQFFIEKRVSTRIARYSAITTILAHYSSQGRQEWVDGLGLTQMTFPIRIL